MTTEYFFNTTNLSEWECYPTAVTGNLDFLSRKAIPGNEVYYIDGANIRVDDGSIFFQERTIQFEAVIIGNTRLAAMNNYSAFVNFINTNKSFVLKTPYQMEHTVMVKDPADIRILNKFMSGALYVFKVKVDLLEPNPDDSLKDGESPATPQTGIEGGSFMDEAELNATYAIYKEHVAIYNTPAVKPGPVNESNYRTGKQYPGTEKLTSGASHVFKGYIATNTIEDAMLKLRQFKHDLLKPGFRRFEFNGRRSFYAACTEGGAVKFKMRGGYKKTPVIIDFSLNLYEPHYNGSDQRFKLNFDGVDQYGEMNGSYIDNAQTLDFLVSGYTASGSRDYLIFEKTGSNGIYLNNSGKVGIRIDGTNHDFNYNNSNLSGDNRLTFVFDNDSATKTASLFVDNVFIESFTITNEYKSTCVFFMAGDPVFQSPSVFTQISIKEFRVWSKIFANEDITSGRHLYNSADQIARFNSILATTESLIDESGNANHYKLYNAPTKQEY